ncbi:MAG: rod-binding protein, partial [Pseudomonadota bacterium]
MNSQNDLTGKLALDVQGMGALRQSAKAGSPEALKSAATQFEAMFVGMMMKSMRDATPQDGMLDSQQSKMFTTMLDQQTSQSIAKKGIGLADVLIRQLSQQAANTQALAIGNDGAGAATPAAPATSRFDPALLQRAIAAAGGAGAAGNTTGATDAGAEAAKGGAPSHVRNFQAKLGAHAEEASRATGIPAKFMLGQAA